MSVFTNKREEEEEEEEEEQVQVAPDYVFDLSDEESWNKYLEEHGYCVLRSVLDRPAVDATIEMIWRDMTALYNVDRADVSTWEKIPTGSAGIVSRGLPQTEGPWVVRGNENVRQAFSSIWNTDDLLVSMDSLLCWLPWSVNPAWEPFSEGLHLDQNPFSKPDRVCVQGMVPLLDVTEASGGLEVVPDSHTPAAKKIFKKNHPQYNKGIYGSDWCPLRQRNPSSPPPLLLMAAAGDLILWDSRTIHGGRVGNARAKYHNQKETDSRCLAESAKVDLARLAVTVCMTPKNLAPKGVLAARKNGFEKGCTFTHWPHEAILTGMWSSAAGSTYTKIELPQRVLDMIY